MGSKLSIIILYHNRPKVVEKVLVSLEEQTISKDEFNIILIDNSYIKKAKKIFKKFNDNLNLDIIEIEECCPAAARNIGISKAKSDIIMLLDDDVIIEKDCVEKHIEKHSYLTEKDIVMGKVELHKDIFNSDVLKWLYSNGAQFDYSALNNKHNTKGILYASNISFRKEIKDKFVFNEQFPTSAWEDIELGYRLIEQGYRIIYYENILAYHYKHESVNSTISRMKKMGKFYPLFVDIVKKQTELDNFNRIIKPTAFRKIINNIKGILFWNGFFFKFLVENQLITCNRFMDMYYYYFFERACRWADKNRDII